MLTMTNGDKYEAVHIFKGGRRAIINLEGLYVMVDLVGPNLWEPSGEPARQGEELELLNSLVKANEGTTTTVTKPDGSQEVYRDDNMIEREGGDS